MTWADLVDRHSANIPAAVIKMIDLLLSFPPTSVPCETSFNQLKLLKTERRGSMAGSTLDALMRIRLTSADIEHFNPDPIIDNWLVSITLI
jgi:hypothetical protein